MGLNAYNKKPREALDPIDVGFFQLHFNLELGHVANVEEELSEVFVSPGFDQEQWYYSAREALDVIHIFWKGLDEKRRTLEE